ncbi:hypothetical protein LTR64_002702 [Lithohypha guttulata]|uniref:uncharacterized protein n=1 Tax=Lithohypha guttulata TaxID=1690604 RepID=UPI002DDE9BC7|nr:hypothetical protein LTR51_001074 [Lithohypha guttulata]
MLWKNLLVVGTLIQLGTASLAEFREELSHRRHHPPRQRHEDPVSKPQTSTSCVRPTMTVTVTASEALTEGPKWSNSTSSTFLTQVTVTSTESLCTANSATGSLSYPPSSTSPATTTIPAAPQPLRADTDTPGTSATNAPPSPTMTVSTASASSTVAPLASPISACETTPSNFTSMPTFFGFNIANTKPVDPVQFKGKPLPVKATEDWDAALTKIRSVFPSVNAFRIYSTTDENSENGKTVVYKHLENALPAAANQKMSILAGVWSGGVGREARFKQERDALEAAVKTFGCSNIAAVSVGNEDMNDINLMPLDGNSKKQRKVDTAKLLIKQMDEVRKMLRQNKCCVPVTHTDTWDEWYGTAGDFTWLPKLIAAVDQAVIANIFPFWSNDTVPNSWNSIGFVSKQTLGKAQLYGKDMWLGETGWAMADPGNNNMHGAGQEQLRNYFNLVGCPVLAGTGTSFYYIDWDEDQVNAGKPSFGLWDWQGQPRIPSLTCSKYKQEMAVTPEMPSFMGGEGFRTS